MCGWTDAIVFLSSLTGTEVEQVMPFPVWDKLLHTFAFAVGGVVLGIALRGTTDWTRRKLATFGWIVLVLFAAADEIHQLMVPHRSGADVGDWTADAIGSAIGLAIAALLYARFTREDRTAPAAA